MGRLERSWMLVKASASVLRSDRELLVFPLLSAISTMIVAATFIVPMAATGSFARLADGGSPYWLVVPGFLFYLAQYFVIFFFNAALVGAARIRLDGGDPTVADGFRIAASRWQQIFLYAALAATVGMILRAIQERAGLIGRWVAGLFGLAWTVATFLVVPILVDRDIGPIDAVRRSAELLKKTWGENLVGTVGLGFVFGLLSFAWMLLGVLLIVLCAKSGSAALVVLAVAATVVGMILLGLAQTALQGIYAAALHRYAETGEAGQGFEVALMEDAFRVKA